MTKPVVLRDLLRDKHWHSYRTFCSQYDKAAKKIDSDLVGTYPSRAQLHRWQSGNLRGLPYPHHCEVLEEMFPGFTAAQIFEPSPKADDDRIGKLGETTVTELLSSVQAGLNTPESETQWLKESLPQMDNEVLDSPAFPHSFSTYYNDKGGPNKADKITRSLLLLGKRLRLSEAEVNNLARFSGNLVDLEMDCSIDIDADGAGSVTYIFHLLNLTSKPVKRMLREQWFETTTGRLKIEPNDKSDRDVSIQRMHDTANMTKFACQFLPIQPGECGMISYTTRGKHSAPCRRSGRGRVLGGGVLGRVGHGLGGVVVV